MVNSIKAQNPTITYSPYHTTAVSKTSASPEAGSKIPLNQLWSKLITRSAPNPQPVSCCKIKLICQFF